jgi:Transmembrane exosortase (Exosortase_EpsH).
MQAQTQDASPKSIAGVSSAFFTTLMVVAGFMVFVAWNQSHWWRLKADYTFGWLVPLFVAYVVYERWPGIVTALNASDESRALSLWRRVMPWALLVGGAGFFLLGAMLLAAAGASYPTSLALTLGLAGIGLGLIWIGARHEHSDGWRVARLFLFPTLVWLVSAPLISLVENALSLFLLGRITTVVVFVFESLGLVIEQRGNVLVLPTGEVGVAEACSGIRSLMGCLFAGSFLGAVCFERWGKKIALIAAAAVFALLMNLIRSLFLTAWAYHYGPEAIEGAFHDWTGTAVIGVTTLGLLALTQLLNLKISVRSVR